MSLFFIVHAWLLSEQTSVCACEREREREREREKERKREREIDSYLFFPRVLKSSGQSPVANTGCLSSRQMSSCTVPMVVCAADSIVCCGCVTREWACQLAFGGIVSSRKWNKALPFCRMYS